jgi:hypothetical protein
MTTIPVKGIKIGKDGKLRRVHTYDASKKRRIVTSKKQTFVSPAKAAGKQAK